MFIWSIIKSHKLTYNHPLVMHLTICIQNLFNGEAIIPGVILSFHKDQRSVRCC